MVAQSNGTTYHGAGLISLQSVSKRFGTLSVLENVSMQIHAGDFIMLDGESGVGKTTLLRLLLGVETPSTGKIVYCDGLRMSAVFQEDRLIMPLSAMRNLQLVTKDKKAAKKILESLDVACDSAKPVCTLSGGMRRRVALARALLASFDILVLDEPFTGLDEENIARAKKVIREQLQGRALILASHLDDGEWMSFRHIQM